MSFGSPIISFLVISSVFTRFWEERNVRVDGVPGVKGVM